MEIHAASRGTYGVPRIHAELAADGVAVGRKRVSRLMRRAGSRGSLVEGERGRRDEIATRVLPRISLSVTSEHRVSVGGGHHVRADMGRVRLYLAVVLDAWSRRVVGWAMANHLRTELVLDALNMADSGGRPV